MQKSLLPALLLFTLFLLTSGCGKDTPTPDNADVWVVTKFVDRFGIDGQVANDDDTHRFAGYAFEFQSDDRLLVRLSNGSQAQGKWRLHTNDTQLSIGVENPTALLEEIVGTWNVEQYSPTVIRLVNPNGMQGGVVDFSKQALRIEFTKQ